MSSGGDADTAMNFAKAICDASGVANTHVQVGSISGQLPKPTFSIPNLRFLHEFIFQDNDKILARRIPGFGEGISLNMTNGIKNVETKYVYEQINSAEASDGKPLRRTSKLVKKPEWHVEKIVTYEEQATENYTKTENEILFECDKNENCVCFFLTFENAT